MPFPGSTFPGGPDVPGSGTITFLELQNSALGNDFDPGRYRTDVKRWINEALGKVARRVKLLGALQGTAEIATVAGTPDYELPVDNVRVLSLRDLDRAAPLEDVGIDAMDQSLASSGRPTAFALFENQLIVYPVPDAEYVLELRYERDWGLLEGDTDTLPLPDAYADLVVNYGRARLFEREDDFEAAQLWQQRFEQELRELRADMGREHRGRVRQVPGMWATPSRAPRYQEP